MKFMPKWRLRKPAEDAKTVYVSEKFGVRSLHIGSDTVQSAMRIARPLDLELAYTRSMMACLLFREDPRDVLMVGLGGGSVAKYVRHHLPQARVRVLELDPQVVAVARQCFLVPPDDDRFEVIVGDGAEYMAREDIGADLIMVDGYDAESHVEALATREFYNHCRERLVPGGMMVVNLWGGDRRFNEVLKRIEAAFPAGNLCLPARKPGNIIAFGFRDPPGSLRWADLRQRASAIEARYGLEFPLFVDGLRTMNRSDADFLYP
ncbi:MAG: polyamine aminopropyltransferase [Burkholderiales bacterium]|nr:polyamine aminopropyltransferase [Burkholderiales bacterium]